MPHKVLLVDDSSVDRVMYRQILERNVKGGGLAFEEVGTAQEGIRALQRSRYDCAFLDYEMPDGNGLEVLRAVERTSKTPVVMLTGVDDTEVAVEALKSGAIDFLMKDRINSGALVSALEGAVMRGGRERVHEERVQHLAVLHALLLQSEDAILVVDLGTSTLIEASSVGLARLGFRRADVVGRDVRTLGLFAGSGGWEGFLATVQDPSRPAAWEPRAPGGKPVPAQVTARTLRVDGKPYLVAQARPQ